MKVSAMVRSGDRGRGSDLSPKLRQPLLSARGAELGEEGLHGGLDVFRPKLSRVNRSRSHRTVRGASGQSVETTWNVSPSATARRSAKRQQWAKVWNELGRDSGDTPVRDNAGVRLEV